MSAPITTPAPAAELLEELNVLLAERAFARIEGLDHHPTYAADLEEDIRFARTAYIGAAVTEIASLRAELSGALQG